MLAARPASLDPALVPRPTRLATTRPAVTAYLRRDAEQAEHRRGHIVPCFSRMLSRVLRVQEHLDAVGKENLAKVVEFTQSSCPKVAAPLFRTD